ncbi:hypothetical protein IEQ34_005865 [Dendrobium chrysotoxum]|uniref:Uncharacterized protein n=1 Tax=Dendrobium chrysotoxum TaxID=161865 RepID=A0AAV7H9T1_DENCH|nr:hypothetical protein IEQ34_005865 [Dendrobium chrysotoxum]
MQVNLIKGNTLQSILVVNPKKFCPVILKLIQRRKKRSKSITVVVFLSTAGLSCVKYHNISLIKRKNIKELTRDCGVLNYVIQVGYTVDVGKLIHSSLNDIIKLDVVEAGPSEPHLTSRPNNSSRIFRTLKSQGDHVADLREKMDNVIDFYEENRECQAHYLVSWWEILYFDIAYGNLHFCDSFDVAMRAIIFIGRSKILGRSVPQWSQGYITAIYNVTTMKNSTTSYESEEIKYWSAELHYAIAPGCTFKCYHA